VCAGANAELVTGLGAEEVVDHTTEDFTRAAGAGRFDAVLDTVGTSSFRRCRGLLTPRGWYLSSELGRFAQNPVLALATVPLPGRSVRFPLPRHDQQMIEHLADLMTSGAFVPVIDRRYPLEEIVAAYRYVETGQKLGNVVITTGGA
jgi:NADPH:quinone reductase-like Zn-dependent oxidoreductase